MPFLSVGEVESCIQNWSRCISGILQDLIRIYYLWTLLYWTSMRDPWKLTLNQLQTAVLPSLRADKTNLLPSRLELVALHSTAPILCVQLHQWALHFPKDVWHSSAWPHASIRPPEILPNWSFPLSLPYLTQISYLLQKIMCFFFFM